MESVASKIHRLPAAASEIALPGKFNDPFRYEPHPLALMASRMVCDYLARHAEWAEEIDGGKMFGVLVVRDGRGVTGFLAAFSGNLAGSNDHDYFVPAVYDMLRPGGFFRRGEAEISALNAEIARLERDPALSGLREEYESVAKRCDAEMAEARSAAAEAKRRRDELRRGSLSEEAREALLDESRHMKAELKRIARRHAAELAAIRERTEPYERCLEELRMERRERSAALQQRLFEEFRFLNAEGVSRSLAEIFASEPGRVPPAGAGECAAPKLLQYAFSHGLTPVTMAEFWQGESPRGEVRRHGCFYPACRGKCGPILGFMLRGLDVDRVEERHAVTEPAVVYDDEWLAVVDKPAGMLSVPGKGGGDSVCDWARRKWPGIEGPAAVHRLDMATSGLLLIAKTPEVYISLQRQFAGRRVVKVYRAILEGCPAREEGRVELPLCPDIHDRPRQMVDGEHGRPAVTDYRVVERMADGRALVEFRPLTGRTHQLRVHAAHPCGLDRPIAGDGLYGTAGGRLMLHAASLRFVHPVTGEEVLAESAVPF